MAERQTHNLLVAGSTPAVPSIFEDWQRLMLKGNV